MAGVNKEAGSMVMQPLLCRGLMEEKKYNSKNENGDKYYLEQHDLKGQNLIP